jgi:hypothetical protein
MAELGLIENEHKTKIAYFRQVLQLATKNGENLF